MSLPKIDVPIYEVKLPSNGAVLKVRPFNVKEEKLLLMALESNDIDSVISTVKQVINNCIIEGTVDINKVPFFDIDYLFIFLRAKSVGETIKLKLTCNNVIEDGTTCGNEFPADIDISNVDIVTPENIDKDIKLTATSGVTMRYPNYSVVKNIESSSDADKKATIIANSIDYIYDPKGTYSYKDYSKEELKDFVEGLTEENFRKLEAFIDNFPIFVAKLDATCPKCHYEHKLRYSDFYDFFT